MKNIWKKKKKIEKLERFDIDLSSHQRNWENFEQENTSTAISVLFVLYNSEEIKLAYKLNYNKGKNQVVLLIINDKANNCYYFAVKDLSEINSLRWLRGKKEAKINNDSSFQNALDDELHYQTIKTNPERISKLKPYINKYNWEEIESPAGQKEWEKFGGNNKTIALDILFIPHNAKTRVAYRSVHNNKRKKQVILLMITDGKKLHYLAVISWSPLLQEKSSNHTEDFFCLNCFNSCTTKNKLKEYEEICNNQNSCRMEMPKWFEIILKYNLGEKSLKAPFAIFFWFRMFIKKEQSYENNNIEKSYTKNKVIHEPSGWAMFTRRSFNEK